MKIAFSASLLLAGVVLAFPGLAADVEEAGDRIIGLWATDKAEAHVEIRKEEDNTYSGSIVWLKDPFYPEGDEEGMAGQPKVDRNNPVKGLRARPIEGLKIMKNFVYDGDDRWVDGEIYDPDNGSTYRCKMWLTEEGTLKVRGYVGISLFGRTTEWTPVLGAPAADTEAVAPGEERNVPATDEGENGG